MFWDAFDISDDKNRKMFCWNETHSKLMSAAPLDYLFCCWLEYVVIVIVGEYDWILDKFRVKWH